MMAAVGWSLVNNLYERPLGTVEQGFYWDSLFNGTADFSEHLLIQVLPGNERLSSNDAILQTWILLKQLFPLLGARVEQRNEHPYFIVDPKQLALSSPSEVSFRPTTSIENALSFVHSMFDGARLLSDDLLSRFFVIPIDPAEGAGKVLVVFLIAHYVTDGIGNVSLARRFLDILSSQGAPEDHPVSIEHSLSLARSSESLSIGKGKNEALLRWQRALGSVLWTIRKGNFKGGQTLPRRFTARTAYTPAKPVQLLRKLSAAESRAVIASCRRLGISFGNTLPVLGQVALARLLARYFSEGRIPKEEWEFRKRQPIIMGGPMNLRPHLDAEWYNAGGASNVSLALTFFFYHLRFMPLGDAADIKPGDSIPDFYHFLSPKRFLYRGNLVKEQAASLLQHPRRLEIWNSKGPARVESAKAVAAAHLHGATLPDSEELTDEQAGKQGPVFAFIGSSLGNKDTLLPSLYPVDAVDQGNATIRLHSAITHLHTRPGELYLGCFTTGGEMHFIIHLDANVVESSVADEWLSQVIEATQAYLVAPEALADASHRPATYQQASTTVSDAKVSE